MDQKDELKPFERTYLDEAERTYASVHVQKLTNYAVLRIDGKRHFEELETILRRALNTWESPPRWARDLSEAMANGKPLAELTSPT
jgi:hypothetical protein